MIESKRAYSIDMLRGVSILLMILSGLEPFGSLPSWMYHAQMPPPAHAFNPDLPGITWVDMVFPFFIFSMGAAIPLSLGRKLKQGISVFTLSFATVKRFVSLLAFAIFARSINPFSISSEPTSKIWLLSILMFVFMFVIWGRWPWKINPKIYSAIKIAGIVLSVVVFYFLVYADGAGFSVYKSNIILYVLSNLVLFGGLIWLFTNKQPMFRLGLLGIILALNLSASVAGSWVDIAGANYEIPFLASIFKQNIAQENLRYFSWIYNLSWIIQWRFLKYLFIIIPASIIGDRINLWMEQKDEASTGQWSSLRNILLMLLLSAVVIITIVGLKGRFVFGTFAITSIISLLILYIVKNPNTNDEKLIVAIFKWGFFWLIIGLLVEPYLGGIKKDPSTLSYYFVSTALAIFCVMIFHILLQKFKLKRFFSLLIYNGQNPMIAYITTPNVIHPILGLLGLRMALLGFYENHPWSGFLLAVVITVSVGMFVSVFSKRKIYLRT